MLLRKIVPALFCLCLFGHKAVFGVQQDSLSQITKGNYVALRMPVPSQVRLKQLNNGAVQQAYFLNLNTSQRLLTQALSAEPENDTLLYNAALVEGQLKNYNQALSLMLKTGMGKRYLNNKGVWHAKMGDLDKSLATWEHAPLADTLIYNKALANFRLGKIDEAIDWSKRIAFAKNPLFHELYAVALFKQNKFKEAEKFFRKSEKITESPRLLVQLGNANLAQQEYEKAEELFTEYIESGHARYRFAARLGLGHALYALKRYREAVLEYDMACRMDEKSVDAWTGLGNAHLGNGGQRQAQKAYERALLLDQLRKDAWLGLAMVNYRLGHYKDAICCFDECKGILNPRNKNHADYYAARGFCRLYNNQVKEAKPDIDSSLRLSVGILPCTALSEYLRMEGYFLSSLKWLEKAFKARGEGHDRMLVNRGNLYLKSQLYEEAFDDFSRAHELNPENVNACNGLGISWLNMDEIDKAKAIYDSLLKKKRMAILLNNRGIVQSYMSLRERQERNFEHEKKYNALSLQDFENGLKTDSSKTAYMVNMGNVYKNREEESPAIEHYQKYLSKTAINNMGVLFSKGTRKDYAQHYLDIAISLDTTNPVFLYNKAKLFHDFYKDQFKKRRDLQYDFKRLPTNDISVKYSPDGFVTVFLFDFDFDTYNFPGEPLFNIAPQPIDDFEFLPSLDYVMMPSKDRFEIGNGIGTTRYKDKSNDYKPSRGRGQGSTKCPKIL